MPPPVHKVEGKQLQDQTVDLVAVATPASLAQFILTSGVNPFTGPQSMGNNLLTDLPLPIMSQDAVNKDYVDTALFGDDDSSYTSENKDVVTIREGQAVTQHSSGIGSILANGSNNLKNAVGLASRMDYDPTYAIRVQTEGIITLASWIFVIGAASLAPKAEYFLDTVNGMLTATPPSAAGQIVQRIGWAVTDKSLKIELGDSIIL